MYQKCFKRVLDFVLSLMALSVLSPVLLVLTVLGAIKMKGNPFFTQLRPGKDEKIFKLIKFRSMTCQKDKDGTLLPDEQRLTKYGKVLRSTSLDELPELIMVFMSPEQRLRHSVRPGLTGLAQVSGRNNITWEEKFEYDLAYIKNGITLWNDIKIILMTVGKVFKREDTVREGTVSDVDFGDWLLEKGEVTREDYDTKQKEAKELMGV